MQYRSAGAHPPQFNASTIRTPRTGAVNAGRSRSFLGFRFVAHDAMHGPHIVEDYTVTRPGGFTNRATLRTAIVLPPAVAEKMSRDQEFCNGVLGFCNERRETLEKTTVVYDPARELGIERLFPKWLFVARDGKQCRDAMACAMPPKHILELASAYPKGFTSTDAWRKWCESLPQHAANQTATDALPPRIAALVLGNDAYFTTPEYRAWIGHAKQKKREEIIARELAEAYSVSVHAADAPPSDSAATPEVALADESAAQTDGVRFENNLDHSPSEA